ncbi:RAS, guanyl releasing protein 3 (predicted), isoform CRA_a [Rattus norvegicus]|uniref:RAS, guanyl releasing protein 3 (Predicted), isoform CRA_a n=1 Tax=Rattus norvegicus TaxID=10116 RepID=A6H9X0_RAT|nr:RAS, guanyl releasing protein 3 (predicted), isoform CRA_a [Rattus norvegicus]|eukprot:NP_001101479.1 ras guanyl-releasing protein 3 [Rattus norvegicus]
MGSNGLGKAATLDELLSTCIEMFDDNGELNDSYLPRIMLLMHRWYLSSTELAGKLLCMYRNASGESCDEFRLKICYFMRYWITKFPAEFNLDLGLIRMTEEFREVASQLGYEKHSNLMDISSIPSYDWMRRVTQRKKVSKRGKACLLFDHLEPIELAEHLTFLEHKSFRRISFTDYQSYVIHGCLENNPTLERSIALFNGISKWVQLMVLSKPSAQQRAEVITKFINVAQKLLQLKNFNTLMAVVGGLSHSSISRLKDTHSHLSSEVTKNWNEMTELVSSNGNYCNYRKAFADCDGFKIPILGVHLKDLIAVHVIFPDWMEENKVNVVKMHQLSVTLSELVSLQNASHHLEPNMDLINLLTLSLDLYHTEDDIYKLSLVLEPRNSKSQPTSPTTPNKPVVPLEWASEVVPKPDPTIINKHIRKLVELWGIIKQGYKCKDCGANCHKQCKDLLVLACRRLARAPSLSSNPESLPGSPALPPVQDEVFEFPGVTARHRDLDSRDITLVTGSSRKISVRVQRATTSQATQTEPVWSEAVWGDSGSHTFPKMKSKLHDKAAKDKGFAKWENEKPTLHAGVDVVDRGTAFEPDQDDEQDEAQQGVEDG